MYILTPNLPKPSQTLMFNYTVLIYLLNYLDSQLKHRGSSILDERIGTLQSENESSSKSLERVPEKDEEMKQFYYFENLKKKKLLNPYEKAILRKH